MISAKDTVVKPFSYNNGFVCEMMRYRRYYCNFQSNNSALSNMHVKIR